MIPSTYRVSSEDLAQKIHFDNAFRLAISITCFTIALFLWTVNAVPSIRPIFVLLVMYTLSYSLIWALTNRIPFLRVLDYALSALDIAVLSGGIYLTGGPVSPFFYLYAIPLLLQAFHFDLRKVVWNGLLSILANVVLLMSYPPSTFHTHLTAFIGQWTFLLIAMSLSGVTVRLLRRKEGALQKSVQALNSNVTLLNELNALDLDLPLLKLQEQLVNRLNVILRPYETFARLWIQDEGWRTLKGVGEHPSLRPGSPSFLPIRACPAFALRRPFVYDQTHTDPCPSEQFNYTAHLCLPISSEKETFGVLFLGTYTKVPWAPEDIHFFEMLAHSTAQTLQRRALLERLKEKVTELNFSFEVGVASLATFVGSTQSIDETTVHILDSVLTILKVDRASLMLWNQQTKKLQTQWVRGTDFRIHSALSLKMGEGMAGWALQVGEPYWAEYAMSDPHYLASALPIKSLLCVPVFTVDRKPLGVINALTIHQPRAFTEREIVFLKSFGQQAALAIENAQLHHKNRANIEHLQELDLMKSQFLSLVSHDLRGPLTGVRGYCEILKQQNLGQMNARQMEMILQLERQVDLQERMVDDLLDFARMEKGRLSIQLAPCDLIKLLVEEVEKSQMEARERQIALTLSPTSAESIPSVLVDEGRIRQVVWNLIHNALKFTSEEGRVVVRATLDAKEIHVEVADTGVGLSVETQDRIFDKFFQITPGGSKGSQGLGLGLAICKEIVLAHRGTIRAFSPGLGQGTTVHFSVPISNASTLASTLAPSAFSSKAA